MANLQTQNETNKSPLYCEVAAMIKEHGEGKEYFFDNYLEVTPAIYIAPVRIYGAEVSPNGNIWLMTSENDLPWHMLEETVTNYHLVITALYNRFKETEDVLPKQLLQEGAEL